MHPRLRRQLAGVRSELPQEFRQLIAAVDAAYREDDSERAELEQSVASLTALLHRAQKRAGVTGEQRKERHGGIRAERQAQYGEPAGGVRAHPDLIVRSQRRSGS
jgi:hypothetical protein